MGHTDHDKRSLEIVQVGIVVRDLEKAIERLNSLWNVGPFRFLEIDLPDAILHGKQKRLRAKLAFAQVGPVELELIQPGEGENIYGEFLRAKGEGVHHLKIPVSDIKSEVARLKERGVEVLQSGDSPQVSFAYMDTEGISGVILEVLQCKEEPTSEKKG
jgi:methylmalonyl-CoA/ethylmalonyl-CoA epimerase